MGRRTKLDDKVKAQVVAAIKNGAFDHVAAQAVGIAPSTFYDWMSRGASGDARFSEFSEEVRIARAKARIEAETKVYECDPKFWLRNGPGKERSSEPGWTDNSNQNRPIDLSVPMLLKKLDEALDQGHVELDDLSTETLMLLAQGQATESIDFIE